MKILVTGSSGQLGREIMRHAEYSRHEYIFTDLRTSEEGVRVQSLDITDQDRVMEAVTPDIDVIINCAAYTDVNGAEADHDAAFKVNALAPRNLAMAALRRP